MLRSWARAGFSSLAIRSPISASTRAPVNIDETRNSEICAVRASNSNSGQNSDSLAKFTVVISIALCSSAEPKSRKILTKATDLITQFHNHVRFRFVPLCCNRFPFRYRKIAHCFCSNAHFEYHFWRAFVVKGDKRPVAYHWDVVEALQGAFLR